MNKEAVKRRLLADWLRGVVGKTQREAYESALKAHKRIKKAPKGVVDIRAKKAKSLAARKAALGIAASLSTIPIAYGTVTAIKTKKKRGKKMSKTAESFLKHVKEAGIASALGKLLPFAAAAGGTGLALAKTKQLEERAEATDRALAGAIITNTQQDVIARNALVEGIRQNFQADRASRQAIINAIGALASQHATADEHAMPKGALYKKIVKGVRGMTKKNQGMTTPPANPMMQLR